MRPIVEASQRLPRRGRVPLEVEPYGARSEGQSLGEQFAHAANDRLIVGNGDKCTSLGAESVGRTPVRVAGAVEDEPMRTCNSCVISNGRSEMHTDDMMHTDVMLALSMPSMTGSSRASPERERVDAFSCDASG